MFDEKEIERLQEKFKFSCRVFQQSIYITSTLNNEWVIMFDKNNKFVLKHKNMDKYSSKKYKGSKVISKMHCHTQKIVFNIYEAFLAIQKHDRRVLNVRNTSTLDKLCF